VILPEDAVTDELVEQVGIGFAEAVLVEGADVVLALVPPGARVSGVFQEIMDFSRIPNFFEKLWIFRPADRIERTAGVGYGERRVYELVRRERFIDYPPEWWPECSDIRAISVQRVVEARRRLAALRLTRHTS
jgi:hypothetical protein